MKKVKTPPRYTTDGRLVQSSEGGFMGIFSTVSLLNDKEILINDLLSTMELVKDELNSLIVHEDSGTNTIEISDKLVKILKSKLKE